MVLAKNTLALNSLDFIFVQLLFQTRAVQINKTTHHWPALH